MVCFIVWSVCSASHSFSVVNSSIQKVWSRIDQSLLTIRKCKSNVISPIVHSGLVIRAQQEANKGLSQEEKQALRKAKKMAKMAKAQEKLAAKGQKEEDNDVAPPAQTKQVDEVKSVLSEPVLTKEGLL